MTKQAKRWAFSLMAASSFACGLVYGGEQVEFKGSTSVELPKPKRPLNNNPRMTSDPERPNLEGGFVTPPAIENSPLTDRKLRESMDKKKNWIFVNPYKDNFDGKTEQFMKGEKGTGLYDNEWMTSKEDKSIVEKFIAEKDQRPREGRDKDDQADRAGDRDRDIPSARDSKDEDLKEGDNNRLSDPATKVQFDAPIFKASASDPFPANGLDRTLDRQSLSDAPFGPARPAGTAFDRQELQQKQIAHEKEFDQILQTRLGSGSGPSLGRIDALNPAAEIGRLDLSGSSSRRSDFGSLGRAPSGGNTVNFTDGGISAFGPRASFESRSGADSFGANPIKLPPSFAPAAPQQSIAAPGLGSAPAPFTLPFPTRKF